MREILFRGKRIDNGEWIEGDLIHRQVWRSYLAIIRVRDDGFDNYTEYEVDPSTIEQYTGLTDKNGKKIFEGDICIVKENGESDYATVGFEHGAFVIYPVNGKITEKTLWDVWYNDFSIEVIGNIHDNPELLEDKL